MPSEKRETTRRGLASDAARRVDAEGSPDVVTRRAADTGGIAFTRLEPSDFDDVVGLTAQAWYSPDALRDLLGHELGELEMDKGECARIARLMATDETAAYLAEMTWGVKALLDGRVVGVIVTQGTHDDAEARARWERLGLEARNEAAAAMARLRGREEHGSEPTEPVYFNEVRATDEMREEAGLDGQPRVLLLVVGAAARGHGLGKRLLNQARDHFRRHGAERYWLVTDTDCDWPFYEHLGLVRLAERAGRVDGAPERYYVYGGQA